MRASKTTAEMTDRLPSGVADEAALRPGERIDKLNRGLKLIQNPRFFCMGADTVLLADFVRPQSGEHILDLGCGNGALTVLLAAESEAQITGLELMPRVAELAQRNLELNRLTDRCRIVCGDIRECPLPAASFDQIICNPPYAKAGCSRPAQTPELAAAKHELHCTLADVFRAAARLLKPSGTFSLICRHERRAEALELAAANGLHPRTGCTVYSSPEHDGKPLLFLLALTKQAGSYEPCPDPDIGHANRLWQGEAEE